MKIQLDHHEIMDAIGHWLQTVKGVTLPRVIKVIISVSDKNKTVTATVTEAESKDDDEKDAVV